MKRTFNSKQEELDFRQKRFIPLNIVAFILSVVAIVSMIIFPLLSIDTGTLMGLMAGGDSTSSEEQTPEQIMSAKILNDSMTGDSTIFDITLLSSIDLITGNADISSITSNMYQQGGMMENMLLYTNAYTSLKKGVDISTLSKETIEGIDFSEIVAEIKNIETDAVTAKTAYVNKVVALAQSLGGTPDSSDISAMENDFDEIVTKGTKDGSFSLEYYVCQELSDGEKSSYAEFEQQVESTDKVDTEDEMAEIGSIFKIVGIAVAGVTGLSILMWLLLALISFIKTFTKNKTYKIWYVAVFGGLPFIIFYALFKIAGLFLTDMLGEFSVMLGCITSMTYIMGICWGVLILFSFFFLIPKRRKIKKLRKAIKLESNAQPENA